MNKFVPISEIDPAICQLPLPNGFDEERIGVHLDRLKSIAALGGFIADQTRIVSASGETSSESVGVAGTSGNSAFGAVTGAASKAKTADSETQSDYTSFDSDALRLAGPLTIKLNSTEIAQRVQRKSPVVRAPQPWATQIDRSLRLEMAKAVWRDTFTTPTFTEGVASTASIVFPVISAQGMFSESPLVPGLLAAGYAGTLNMGRFTASVMRNRRLQEEHFSLTPFYHVDRAVAATARLACSRLIKPL